MEHMEIWNALASVPEEAKKTIKGGRLSGMTDINPVWRLKRMSECFGLCGVGWWYEITDKRILEDEHTHTKSAFVDVMLYYFDPVTGVQSHGIPGTGGASYVSQEKNGAYASDECFKMALTDALSVAMKAIGVGADVYWAQGRTKYNRPVTSPAPTACVDCGAEIKGYTTKDGKTVSAEQWIHMSRTMFGGAALCTSCAAKRKEGGSE